MTDLGKQYLKDWGISEFLPEEGRRITMVQIKVREHNLEFIDAGNLYQSTGHMKLKDALKASGLEDYLQMMENLIEKIEEESEW